MNNRDQRRAAKRFLEVQSQKYPEHLVEIPRDQWPDPTRPIERVLRSREFLVQVYAEPFPVVARLSVNRTELAGERWRDGISWETMQRLKNEAGYSEHDAVELFPAAADEVNVANMRHLWVLASPVPFAWRRS